MFFSVMDAGVCYTCTMKLLDKDIREPLFDFLEQEYRISRIIEEKQMGKCRADAVMVTEDALYGIEIKSDADTYARLRRQVKYYDRYFDYNYIVAGVRHAGHVEEHVPSWWGIIIAEDTGGTADLYVKRRPARNPKMKPEDKLSLLWRPELARIQERNGMFRYQQKSKEFVREKILEKIPPDVLHREISAELFERDYTRIDEEIASFRNDR